MSVPVLFYPEPKKLRSTDDDDFEEGSDMYDSIHELASLRADIDSLRLQIEVIESDHAELSVLLSTSDFGEKRINNTFTAVKK